jgi:type II secretory pathway predicted ATPase ExeA
VVSPAMFATLACVTGILLIVILIATSRSKDSARASQLKLHAGSAKTAGRPTARVESAGALRPRVRQEFESKAVVKATLTDSRLQAAKAANLKSPIDRKVQSMTFPAAHLLNERAEKIASSATANPEIAAGVQMPAAAAPVSSPVETASPATNGSGSQICAAPSQQAGELKDPLQNLGQEKVASEASAPAELKQAEAAKSAPVPVGADHSSSSRPFAAPVQKAPITMEMLFPPLTRGNPANVSAAPAKHAAQREVSNRVRVEEASQELRAPTLLEFYGLKQQPFDVTPDPAYLYRSRVHREAFTAISQGIENLRGFMALIAEPGMGKTTLLNKLMEELSDSARVVFLFQTQCNSSELLRHLLTELEVEFDGTNVVAMHKALNQALFEEMLQGRRFVLIVDEAQNLEDSALETIRLLSNYETTHSKLIQIVLAGQPQLVETLMRPGLVQLRQRIAVLANLEPLDAAETAEYIEHRLRAAGAGQMPVFSREAMAMVAERSQGTPRSINNICFNAMLAGYMHRQMTIDTETVKKVASKLDLELLVRRPRAERSSVSPAPAPAPAPASSELSQLANLLSCALAGKTQPEVAVAPDNSDESKSTLALTGRLNEKVTSQSWSNKNEFQIQVSLERDRLPGLPIADHYYCRSFYVSEEQAKSLQPGKAVRVKFEQD